MHLVTLVPLVMYAQCDEYVFVKMIQENHKLLLVHLRGKAMVTAPVSAGSVNTRMALIQHSSIVQGDFYDPNIYRQHEKHPSY